MSAAPPRPAGRAFPFQHEVRVSLRDLDAFGHVNHSVYLSYLEVARTLYYFARRGMKDVGELDFILASIACRYRSPAFLHETLVVHLGPTKIGGKSWDLAYEIRESTSGRLVADAETTQVQYDYGAGRAVAIPPGVRALLERDRIPE